eukprot:NODE_385_length_9550_cov_0.159877.p4 type:complete len:137 gc:universal NODE_385_length_9550_cov_0.159877:917-507(-)
MHSSYPIHFSILQTLEVRNGITGACTSQTCTRCVILKKTNLESCIRTNCHFGIDRDHMAATNIQQAYSSLFNPVSSSAEVSNCCSRASGITSFSVSSRFSQKSVLLIRKVASVHNFPEIEIVADIRYDVNIIVYVF